MNAMSINTIASRIDLVNTKTFSSESENENPGDINTWPNQPAERLPLIPANTLSHEILSLFEKNSDIKTSITFLNPE